MYSTKTAITNTVKDILLMLDDYDIYSYYLGNFRIGRLYNSPLRPDDKNPSFGIYQSKYNTLMFKDLGSGQYGNSLTFVKLYNHIDSDDELEKELLRIVKKINPTRVLKQNRKYDKEHLTDIGIARQPFTQTDIDYWSQYHISLDTLHKYQVFSIKYFLCNGTVRGVYKESSPMYAYKVFDKFKIYRPLASKYTKWRSNLTNYHVQGLAELPKRGGNLLIITKSLKDVMVLYEMGYNAISASSETTFIPIEILDKLKVKWKNVLILYDRDSTGMMKAREYSKQYGLNAFFIHRKFKAKDISDAVKYNGFDNVKIWLDKTLECYGRKS